MIASYGAAVAHLFRMDEETWARHASPWSVFTRIASLPLLLLTLWSHAWLGWQGALVATLAVCIWLWANPRLFPAPVHTDNWASKTTFGERIWLNRNERPIPLHHGRAVRALSASAAIGFLVSVVAALWNDLTWTIAGGLVAWFSKLWFVDRMVWLFEDMKDSDPRYRGWIR